MKGCVDLELASPVWHLPPQPGPLTSPCLEKSRGWGGGRGTDPSTEGKCGPPPAPGTTALVPASFLGARTVCGHQHGMWRFLDTRDQRLTHRAALTQRKCFSDAADNSRDKEHTHRQTQQIHTHTRKQTYKGAHRHTQQMHKQTLSDHTDTCTEAHRQRYPQAHMRINIHIDTYMTGVHRDRHTHNGHTDTQRHLHAHRETYT